jgi:hypothetical protein
MCETNASVRARVASSAASADSISACDPRSAGELVWTVSTARIASAYRHVAKLEVLPAR